MSDTLYMLKDDAHYYGEYGRQFLSNSDIRTLLKDPAQFRKERPDGKPLVEGRYFHVSLLEPHKKDSIQIVDASSRNTNIYKDAVAASGKDILLLRGEAEELDGADGEGAYATNEFIELDDDDSDDYDD